MNTYQDPKFEAIYQRALQFNIVEGDLGFNDLNFDQQEALISKLKHLTHQFFRENNSFHNQTIELDLKIFALISCLNIHLRTKARDLGIDTNQYPILFNTHSSTATWHLHRNKIASLVDQIELKDPDSLLVKRAKSQLEQVDMMYDEYIYHLDHILHPQSTIEHYESDSSEEDSPETFQIKHTIKHFTDAIISILPFT